MPTAPLSRAVTQVNAPRGTDGGDGRHARLVPADAGVDDASRRPPRSPAASATTSSQVLAALDQVEHREAVDDDEVAARPPRASARTISTAKRMRFSSAAAPVVVALVGARREELVDQVALGAHDLDAVVAGLAGEPRAAREVVDGALDAARRSARAGVNGVIGDLSADGATDERVVGVAAGVQDLQRDPAALGVHGVRDRGGAARPAPGSDSCDAARLEPAGDVRREAAGDDQRRRRRGRARRSTPRACSKSARPVLEAGVHRAHEDAVAQRREPEVQRGEQVRVRIQ